MSGAAITILLRRWPYCAASLVLTIGLLIGAWFLREKSHELEVIHRERAKEGEAMLSLLVGGSTQRQELATVREIARRIDDNLVVEANLAENLWYFYKLEEQTKARLPELHQMNSPSSDKSPLYRRVPYTLRVLGTYDQVAAFLLALETGPRLVKITAFSYARTDANGTNMSLDLSVELLGKK
jgi:Tfp pilus assembly protein PilO